MHGSGHAAVEDVSGFFVYWRKERECTDLDMRRLRM